MNKIIIIGGGFSGTMLAIQLMRYKPSVALDIILIEKFHDFGKGLAYGTQSPHHLLNVPAGKMSGLPQEPEHFLNWLRQKNFDLQPSSFVSRTSFGEYMADCLAEAEQSKPENIHFQKLQAEVVSIEDLEISPKVRLQSGVSLPAHQIVLALGNCADAVPNSPASSFYEHPRFIANPWNADAIADIPPEADLFILGTGLTMVDKVLQLQDQGHRGKIVALSRKGMIPQVHDLSVQPFSKLFDETDLTSLRQMVKKFRATLSEKGLDWRALVDGLRPDTQNIWRQLAEKDKKTFLRHLRPYWEYHRHRMAPQVHAEIQQLLKTGQLTLLAGRIQDYNESSDDVEIVIQPRKQREYQSLRVAHVLNCSGSGTNFLQRKDLLTQQLFKDGHIVPDSLNLGLTCRPDGSLLNSKGLTTALFTLGPPMKGLLWESTAVPDIRQQAQSLAKVLIESIPADAEKLSANSLYYC
ncbi:FAD/NAD(P)-binding protein [Vampirovibrio sp.]|uniref:FAD/NAD(P)-binding protein n=1 Tax=Vampirovibrio sp. TaxID=2717857 RepID=UPI003594705C